jgi:hypothetical protein
MKTRTRRFSKHEITQIISTASSHSDRRAAASTSLLLALSIPMAIQEFLLWKNLSASNEGTSIISIGRFVRLELREGSAIYKHFIKLRAVSIGAKVFSKLTPDSATLAQLNEEILVQANVVDCSHADLSEWSRRQNSAYRLELLDHNYRSTVPLRSARPP